MQIEPKEIVFGILGTLIGGIFVWSITRNIDLTGQMQAVELIGPKVEKAQQISILAESKAKESLERVDDTVNKILEKEQQVDQIIGNLNTVELLKEIDSRVEVLKQTARDSAREAAADIGPISCKEFFDTDSKKFRENYWSLGEIDIESIYKRINVAFAIDNISGDSNTGNFSGWAASQDLWKVQGKYEGIFYSIEYIGQGRAEGAHLKGFGTCFLWGTYGEKKYINGPGHRYVSRISTN